MREICLVSIASVRGSRFSNSPHRDGRRPIPSTVQLPATATLCVPDAMILSFRQTGHGFAIHKSLHKSYPIRSNAQPPRPISCALRAARQTPQPEPPKPRRSKTTTNAVSGVHGRRTHNDGALAVKHKCQSPLDETNPGRKFLEHRSIFSHEFPNRGKSCLGRATNSNYLPLAID